MIIRAMKVMIIKQVLDLTSSSYENDDHQASLRLDIIINVMKIMIIKRVRDST